MEDNYSNIYSRRQKGIVLIKLLLSKLNIDLKEPIGLLLYILKEIDLYYVFIFVFFIYNTINGIFKVVYKYFNNRKVLVKAS